MLPKKQIIMRIKNRKELKKHFKIVCCVRHETKKPHKICSCESLLRFSKNKIPPSLRKNNFFLFLSCLIKSLSWIFYFEFQKNLKISSNLKWVFGGFFIYKVNDNTEETRVFFRSVNNNWMSHFLFISLCWIEGIMESVARLSFLGIDDKEKLIVEMIVAMTFVCLSWKFNWFYAF